MKINHVNCSWAMLTIKVAEWGDEELIAAKSIDWDATRKIETNYGQGGQPMGRGIGNVTYTGKITLPIDTINTLCEIEGNETKTLMGLGSFDLIVDWTFDGDTTTHNATLKDCCFNSMGMSAKQDDTSIDREYDLNPFRIYTDGSLQTDPTDILYAK